MANACASSSMRATAESSDASASTLGSTRSRALCAVNLAMGGRKRTRLLVGEFEEPSESFLLRTSLSRRIRLAGRVLNLSGARISRLDR